jgi:spore germination protein YaaH
VIRRPLALLFTVTLAATLPAGAPAALATDPVADGSVVLADGRVLPPLPVALRRPSVHGEMLALHTDDEISFRAGARPSVPLAASGSRPSRPRAAGTSDALGAPAGSDLPNGLRKEVFGFLPYWMLTDGALAHLNYNLVSTIAYFSVGATKRGALIKGTADDPSTGWAGWKSSRMTQVIDRAHGEGVKVVLTVTMMAWDSAGADRQAQLLTSQANRTRMVNAVVGAVEARNADGVNLDFEPLATSLRDEYVALVRQLKAGLGAAGAGDYVTVSVMASAATWATGYDVYRLTRDGAADHLFVMGYDYHWSGSSRAGGVAPIQSPYTIDVDGTMLDFLSQTSGRKLIWGVPYYGRTWLTTSKRLNARTLGWGSKAYFYTGALAQAAQHGRRWDDVGKVPWYRSWDGAASHWVQGYYDDRRSLGVKYDLVNARGLAGTGMWTLLMDQGRDELWQLLAHKFVTDTAPPVGGIALMRETTDRQAIHVRWRAIDHASGVRHFNVQVKRAGGSWRWWRRRTAATDAWYAGHRGATYLFRVQAVDRKGNRQRWVTLPAEPAELSPSAFAKVAISTLNVRTGPGTDYPIVAQAGGGDVVYVLEGPVVASGMEWYRVQYAFAEWPSSSYPRVGWMSGGTAEDPYLLPRMAPSRTLVDPFVSVSGRSPAFSPNGDGVKDAAVIGYRLDGAASAVRLEILDRAGRVIRTRNLGAQAAGSHTAQWSGFRDGGAAAPQGRYLTRLTATEGSGSTHLGPSPRVTKVALATWGMRLDVTPPSLRARPGPGAAMVPAHARLRLAFAEAMHGIGAAPVELRRVGGRRLDLELSVSGDRRRLVAVPVRPLPVGRRLRVTLDGALQDRAGNPPDRTAWSFETAPGRVYDPPAGLRIGAGTRRGYRIGSGGDLRSVKSVDLVTGVTVTSGQRARLPNLPGRWLHVDGGRWAGYWIRESAAVHLAGRTEIQQLDPASTVIRLRAGDRIGFRFDAAGKVTATRSLHLTATTTARADRRLIINGRRYLGVASGPLRGYLVRESARAFLPGFVSRMDFTDAPRIRLSGGTYEGHRYRSDGSVKARVRVTVAKGTRLNVQAWAVINGRRRFLVGGGDLAGTWIVESRAIGLVV